MSDHDRRQKSRERNERDEREELLTIGALGRRTGLPVRTIRFWSDIGVAPPVGRSTSGYRLYDAGAVARLELVRTLRDLGFDLETVRRVLASGTTVREVAATHLRALDAEIRALRIRRAVLRWIAQHGSRTEEMRLMHELARMSADQRQRIIDDFVHEVFDGVPPTSPGAGIAEAMRALPAELPADPTSEQLEAWVELGALVRDEAFRRRVREMAVAGTRAGPAAEPSGPDPARVQELAGRAVREGTDPASDEARAVLDQLVSPELSTGERDELADQLATFTDGKVERYWQLLGVLNGWPARAPAVPAFEWLIAALRARPAA
ncbi:MerR family transcriptional regulator [Streptomyces sedi]|uniref:MerR family transcriptional regulator n=1 Tax=Streptomyces sedi TaxID=555059 RepID=A0A5C4VDC7_9ACTN|nr:MerR family transcriptional regulator [Streptomyces sedi]TNM33545.1 MerR family transcriptional regulator [Streptomyces sedi]